MVQHERYQLHCWRAGVKSCTASSLTSALTSRSIAAMPWRIALVLLVILALGTYAVPEVHALGESSIGATSDDGDDDCMPATVSSLAGRRLPWDRQFVFLLDRPHMTPDVSASTSRGPPAVSARKVTTA
jgi:hypothetical protein